MKFDCPYGADDCPKVLALKEDLDRLTATVDRLLYAVYVLCGITMIQTGLVIL